VDERSSRGGQPPLDPRTDAEERQTDDFDAVFYPGDHGPLWDLVDDVDSIRLMESTSPKAIR